MAAPACCATCRWSRRAPPVSTTTQASLPSAPVATHTSSTTSTTGTTSTDPSSTPSSYGAPSSFQQCVAWRESSNTPTDPDGLYGILPSTWASLGYSGTAGEASVAVQNQAFQKLYAQDGTSPWAQYDGC